MMLGDLMAQLGNDAVAAEALMALEDIALAARAQEAAEYEGLSAGEYARMALQRFSSGASDEEWVQAIGLMARTSEPGAVLLRQALIWMLKREEGAGG